MKTKLVSRICLDYSTSNQNSKLKDKYLFGADPNIDIVYKEFNEKNILSGTESDFVQITCEDLQ